MKEKLTRTIDQKFRLGLIIVIVLNAISLCLSTIWKQNISEDLRISIAAFSAASLCALGLKYLIYRINRSEV